MIIRILAFIGLVDIVLFVSALMSLLLYNLNEDEREDDEEQEQFLMSWKRDKDEKTKKR